MPEIVEWKRFLCPRDGVINLGDQGYLYDPETTWGATLNPNVVTYTQISSTRCVIMLGEPGSGKSIAFEQFADKHHGSDQAMHIDLNICSSDRILYRKLFESPQFIQWKNSDATLHLFLDSLDECLPRIGGLISLLASEFRELPLDRLYVRIACRTADWTTEFENEFRRIWNDNQKVLELAPLRKQDVRMAAANRAINVDGFMEAIAEKEIQSLAIKPITLDMLLDMYQHNQTIPGSQNDLYLTACERLCETVSRLDGRVPRLDVRTRLQVASRIAFLTVFSARRGTWIGRYASDKGDDALSLQEISFGNGEHIPTDFILHEVDIREVIGTGLFSSRGGDHVGFAHQTYQEFLSAYFIKNLPLSKILTLIVHPHSGTRITPQLRQVVSWLAVMNQEVRMAILTRDPQILVRSDTVYFTSTERQLLVDALLEEYSENRVVNPYELVSSFSKLNHPGLPAQLRPYITDSTQDVEVRQAAMRMVQACKLNVFQAELTDVALNNQESATIRVTAAYTVRDCADPEYKARLLTLTELDAAEDPDDELKGIALQALYPTLLPTEDLFQRLALPQRQFLTGAYKYFMNYKLVDQIPVADLPIALKWCEQHTLGHDARSFEDLVHDILLRGWANLEVPEILIAFLPAIWHQVHNYHSVQFLREEDPDGAKTHLLITEMMKQCGDAGREIFNISRRGLLTEQDFHWLIGCLNKASDSGERTSWTTLIYYEIRWTLVQTELLYDAVGRYPEVAEKFKGYFDAVELGSQRAAEMRSSYYEHETPARQGEPVFRPDSSDIEDFLNDYDSGDLDAWIRLHKYMATSADGLCRYHQPYETDLTEMPGWAVVDMQLRSRIIENAQHYLIHAAPSKEESELAGFRSLLILFKLNNEWLEVQDAQLWNKWVPAVVVCACHSDKSDDMDALLKTTYRIVPDTVLSHIARLIKLENEHREHLFCLQHFDALWDDKMTGALIPLLRESALKPNVTGQLISYCLKYSFNLTIQLATDLISSRIEGEDTSERIAIVVANELMSNSEEGWDIVLRECKDDLKFGQEVFLRFASLDFPNFKFPYLDAKKRADAYLWLQSHFPYEDDPDHNGIYTPTSRDHVGTLRDSLLRGLVFEGTPGSYREMERITGHLFPRYRWMRRQLAEAELHAFEVQWNPLPPGMLLRFVYISDSRLVQNGEHLMDVIIEALKEIQSELHGVTPAVVDLWDELATDKQKPVSENSFSNWVIRRLRQHFRGKGIVANREVEIRERLGDTPGERTDIHVQATSQGGLTGEYGVITVVIEVKGNWHDELKEAMETQLLQRYLTGTGINHGIYLVGWFSSTRWDPDDRRKAKVERLNRMEVQKQLETQVKDLSFQSDTRIKLFILDTHL